MDSKPRLLIVEDSESQRENLAEIMETPRQDWREGTGVVGFEVDTAESIQSARECIQEALQARRPHEVVLLDLELPGTDNDARMEKISQAHGRAFLTEIVETTRAAVVIVTGYPSPENYVHAVREGATDFIAKPLQTRQDEKMLFTRLLVAVGKTRAAVHRELRSERLLRLKEEDRKRDFEIVSEKVTVTSEELHELSEALLRRYGLDSRRDAGDPICEQLAAVERVGGEMLQALLQRGRQQEAAPFVVADIGEIVDEEVARARPCFLHRDVSLEWIPPSAGLLQTMTFVGDVCLIAAELALGSLEMSTAGSRVRLVCERSDDGNDILVSVERSGEPVPEDVCCAVKDGRFAAEKADRRWQGLYFLQRLANNIGASIEMESNEARTIVTIRLPVLDNG